MIAQVREAAHPFEGKKDQIPRSVRLIYTLISSLAATRDHFKPFSFHRGDAISVSVARIGSTSLRMNFLGHISVC